MISFALHAAALLLNGNPSICEAPYAARARDHASAPSLTGIPGLFEIPAAISSPDRSATLSFNNAHTLDRIANAEQRNAFVGFGFIPRLTLVARGAWLQGTVGQGWIRDISVNAHLLLASEGVWTPSLAIGAQDFGAENSFFSTKYVVASRSLLGRARISAGYGSNGYSLNGPFGGVEVSPCSWITGIAENESHRRNYGARISPLGSWGARKGIEPTIDLLWREGQGRMYGVGLRIQAGSPARDDQNKSNSVRVETGKPLPAQAATGNLASALVAHGFENVRTAVIRDTLVVTYENRVYNRDEWDALGIVMAEASRHAGSARVLKVSLLRVDLPVMQVVSGIDAFNNFVAGAMDRAAFATQLVITNAASTLPVPASNSSRFHLDLTARPRVEQLILTDVGVYESRLSIIPEARVQLWRGISLSAKHVVKLHTSKNFLTVFGDSSTDQILLHSAHNGFPFSRSASGLITQLSVGQFGTGKVGVAAEFDNVIADGRVSVGGVVGAFGKKADIDSASSVAYGSIRWRQAPLDLAFKLTAGRFARGDIGATAEVERRFGLGEVAFFAQHTDFDATMAGIRVSVPLTFRRDPRPGPIRFRLPDYGDISHMSQVLKFNATRRDVANELDTGGGMAKTFRGRDRLNSLRLIRELETIRAAARACGSSQEHST